mmetsp:Transcript_30084/g.29332  ORF Transcript_30084/g.29332 Transcript_30084/m.29332 type:complete len:86 (+) Transcript_30084:507-764(+)
MKSKQLRKELVKDIELANNQALTKTPKKETKGIPNEKNSQKKHGIVSSAKSKQFEFSKTVNLKKNGTYQNIEEYGASKPYEQVLK